jgi:hypothetical protein
MPKVGIKRARRTAGRSVYRRRNPEPFHSLVRDHAFGSYIVIPEGNQDGDVDWSVEADLIDPETGDLESYSASLSFALGNGTFSHPWEREIPESVLKRMDALADRLADAGLY